MNRKTYVAGVAGFLVAVSCGGESHQLGGRSQSAETDGGGLVSSTGGTGGSEWDLNHTGGIKAYSAEGGPSGAGGSGTGGGPSGTGGGPFGAGGTIPTQPTPGITTPSIGDAAPWLAPSGKWTGYVENFKFPSGSDALLFAAGQETNGGDAGAVLSATLTLGQTGGTVPSPSDVIGIGGGPGMYDVVEGHAYTVVNGSVDGMRLQFDISITEIWDAYCGSRSPKPGTTSCSPAAGFPPSASVIIYGDNAGHCSISVNGVEQPADCTEIAFCGGVCVCDTQNCFTYPKLVHFDMTLSSTTFPGGHYDGSVATLPDAPGILNVHFSPQ